MKHYKTYCILNKMLYKKTKQMVYSVLKNSNHNRYRVLIYLDGTKNKIEKVFKKYNTHIVFKAPNSISRVLKDKKE